MIPNVGDKIKLLEMVDDPYPLPAGTTGIVKKIHHSTSWNEEEVIITVDWDDPSTLNLVCPPDKFEIIQSKNSTNKQK